MTATKVIAMAVLLCVPVFALNADRKLSQYAHTAWRIQDGFFAGSPWAITQTADGFIWVGTSSGIVRVDGVRFVPWNPPSPFQFQSPFLFVAIQRPPSLEPRKAQIVDAIRLSPFYSRAIRCRA